MYLARNEGNMCNVASDAWYPIVSATTTTAKTTTSTTQKQTTITRLQNLALVEYSTF